MLAPTASTCSVSQETPHPSPRLLCPRPAGAPAQVFPGPWAQQAAWWPGRRDLCPCPCQAALLIVHDLNPKMTMLLEAPEAPGGSAWLEADPSLVCTSTKSSDQSCLGRAPGPCGRPLPYHVVPSEEAAPTPPLAFLRGSGLGASPSWAWHSLQDPTLLPRQVTCHQHQKN